MAMLKPKEIRSMRPDDIKAKFKELNDELMHERGVAAMGGAPASPGKIRALRTSVARIHTIQREMQLAEARKAAAEKAPSKRKTRSKKSDKKAKDKSQEEKK